MLSSDRFAAAFTEAESPPRTLIERAYRQLRKDIIDGILQPDEKLRVEHLKDRYDVGAGTLREALVLLLSDALVVAEGQRGFRVAPISMTDFAEITEARILLEVRALQHSLKSGGDEWEANLVAAYHRLTKAEEKLGSRRDVHFHEWEARNRSFHEALIAGCKSGWLRYLIGIVYRQAERYRQIALTKASTSRNVHAEHAELFAAATQRDVKLASKLLTHHIQLTFDLVRAIAPRSGNRPLSKRTRG